MSKVKRLLAKLGVFFEVITEIFEESFNDFDLDFD